MSAPRTNDGERDLAAALRGLAADLRDVDWPGGSCGEQTIVDAADALDAKSKALAEAEERARLPYPFARLWRALECAVAETQERHARGGMRVGMPHATLELPLDVAMGVLRHLDAARRAAAGESS